jgi:hypothetical protein
MMSLTDVRPAAAAGPGTGRRTTAPETPRLRDGKWEALIQNFNVFVRLKGKSEAVALSVDGSEGNYYTFASITWSPDSKRLVAYRVRPGYRRQVHFVESSPSDQLQPKHSSRDYAKPGDALDVAQPVLFDVETKKQTVVDNGLFPNPYGLSNSAWRKDGRAFTFEYNQRGHQVYRVIEVDGRPGRLALSSVRNLDIFFLSSAWRQSPEPEPDTAMTSATARDYGRLNETDGGILPV